MVSVALFGRFDTVIYMKSETGRVSLFTIVLGLILVGAVLVDPFHFSYYSISDALAGTATTTVTVLNTPPEWAVDAQEYIESSTSSPTNVGDNVVWIGTATDSNAEPYYLLLCKSSSTPTPNVSAAPVCGGGAGNQWGVSSLTAANVQATTTYTALVGDPESNPWFAWICDQNTANPKCNSVYKQGTGTSSSPFAVNHRPNFTVATDSSPANPGAVVTWNTTSSDPDSVGGADQVRLFVCKANDFATTTCGGGGTYCSSTLVGSAPSCTSTLATPLQDTNYTAFTYVIDNHNFAASGGAQATDTVVTVNNVAPTVDSSTILLEDPTSTSSPLTLSVAQGETTGFKVKFTAVDNNSCQNISAGNEIASATVNVYRSGITQALCETSGQYNANDCYPSAVSTSTWGITCSQDGGSCSGSSDPDATWTCTFPLWYVADPTDGVNATDSQHFAENWRASVRARDDNSATSSLTEISTGKELLGYLAYNLNTAAIGYGSYEPASGTPALAPTTTVSATGNVGLDLTLYGTDMCTTFPTCAATSTTSTVQMNYQHYATSGVAYGSGVSLAANPGAELEINILKTTVTSTPAFGSTYWGIQIPASITLAGDYTGQNTIIGITGEAQFW